MHKRAEPSSSGKKHIWSSLFHGKSETSALYPTKSNSKLLHTSQKHVSLGGWSRRRPPSRPRKAAGLQHTSPHAAQVIRYKALVTWVLKT